MNLHKLLAIFVVCMATNAVQAMDKKEQYDFKFSVNTGNAHHKNKSYGASDSDNANSFEIGLDYSITENLSIGLSVLDLGQVSLYEFSNYDAELDLSLASNVNIENKGITMALQYQAQVEGSAWGGYVRGGLISWQTKREFNQTTTGAINESYQNVRRKESVDLFFGFGATYDFSERLGLDIGVSRYKMPWEVDVTIVSPNEEIESRESIGSTINNYSLGLTYRF